MPRAINTQRKHMTPKRSSPVNGRIGQVMMHVEGEAVQDNWPMSCLYMSEKSTEVPCQQPQHSIDEIVHASGSSCPDMLEHGASS